MDRLTTACDELTEIIDTVNVPAGKVPLTPAVLATQVWDVPAGVHTVEPSNQRTSSTFDVEVFA
jgi:hypothetical protein